MKLTQVLTEEQKKIAEDYHNLIYAYLHRKRLPIDDYYGLVALGYLRAVVNYDTRPELRRYSFTTIAWRHMDSDLKNHFEKQARRHTTQKTLSIDYKAEEGGCSLGDQIACDTDIGGDYDDYEYWKEMQSVLDRRLFQILICIVQGYTRKETAELLNTTIFEVYAAVKEIKEIIQTLTDTTASAA